MGRRFRRSGKEVLREEGIADPDEQRRQARVLIEEAEKLTQELQGVLGRVKNEVAADGKA